MEVALTLEVVSAVEEAVNRRLLVEEMCSRGSLAGKCRSHSFPGVASGEITFFLLDNPKAFGLVWEEEVVVCCIAGRAPVVAPGSVGEEVLRQVAGEEGCRIFLISGVAVLVDFLRL